MEQSFTVFLFFTLLGAKSQRKCSNFSCIIFFRREDYFLAFFERNFCFTWPKYLLSGNSIKVTDPYRICRNPRYCIRRNLSVACSRRCSTPVSPKNMEREREETKLKVVIKPTKEKQQANKLMERRKSNTVKKSSNQYGAIGGKHLPLNFTGD